MAMPISINVYGGFLTSRGSWIDGVPEVGRLRSHPLSSLAARAAYAEGKPEGPGPPAVGDALAAINRCRAEAPRLCVSPQAFVRILDIFRCDGLRDVSLAVAECNHDQVGGARGVPNALPCSRALELRSLAAGCFRGRACAPPCGRDDLAQAGLARF